MTITTDIPLGGWQADVGIFGGSGSSTSMVVDFNQTVPVGTVLVAAVQSGGFSSVTATDTQGNPWVNQVNSSINGASIHLVLWTCVVATQLTASDSVTFTFTSGNSSGALTSVISAYIGVSTSTPVDSAVTDGDQANPGTSLTQSPTGASTSPNEVIYVAWDLQNTTGGIVWDPNYELRTQATSIGTIRTVQPTDNVVTSTGTYTSSIAWANSANVAAAMLGLILVAVPPEVTTIPSGTEGGRLTLDSGTSKVNFTPSDVDVAIRADAGTATVGFSQPTAAESYLPAGGGSSTDIDAGTATIGFDQSLSVEFPINIDSSLVTVIITQPAHREIAQFVDGTLAGTTSELGLWELSVGELGTWQFANGQTNFITFQPALTEPIANINPCLHPITFSPRWHSSVAGGRWSGLTSVPISATTRPRWKVTDSGKCLV